MADEKQPEQTGYEEKPTDEFHKLLESEQDAENVKKLNRELFGRATRAEHKLKELEGKKAAEQKPDIQITVSELLALQKLGFTAPEQIEEIVNSANELGTPVLKFINNPISKAGIEAKFKKQRVVSKTLPPSDRFAPNAEPASEIPNESQGRKTAREAFNRSLAKKGGEE